MNKGCVDLVGAGCGGADLITLRGLAALRACQVAVYDDLISEDLLAQIPAGAETIYVGKRRGRHSASQDEICDILIQQARLGKRVVRLKGGDPFVFGRGGEEILALREVGVTCREIPGVSSAIAIPALAGIPVTHRGLSQGVHIITAHTRDSEDGLPEHLDSLARLPDTLVFLMGLHQLERLAERLTAAGKPPETPAAVISGKPDIRAVRGTLETIAARTRAANLEAPAVIVVGPVAALDLSSGTQAPLAGVRVGVTGSPAIIEKLKSGLSALGAEVRTAGPYEIEELPSPISWSELEGPVWCVFTSGNGVELFFQRMRREGIDIRRLSGCRFAAIGPATSGALAEHGIRADLCPALSTSEELAEALLRETERKEPIFLFRSAQGSPVLPRRLAGSRRLRDIPLYEMRMPTRLTAISEPLDYLTFASANGVRFFFQRHGTIPPGTIPVCIGPVTARALWECTTAPFLTASEISTEGLIQEIRKAEKSHHPENPMAR